MSCVDASEVAAPRPFRFDSPATQCLLALSVSVLVLVGCFTARAVMQRSSAGAKLASLRAQAAASAAHGGEQGGADAAPLWLRAAALSNRTRRASAQSLALISRAARLDGCHFATSKRMPGRPGTSLAAAASLTTLPGCDMVPGGRGMDAAIGLVFAPAPHARALSRLLATEAVRLAHRGDMGGAAERLREGFVLARHLCQTADAASVVTAAGVDQVMSAAAARVLAAGKLPRQAARRLSAELGSLDYYAALGRAMDVERSRLLSEGSVAEAQSAPGVWERVSQAVDRASGAQDALLLQRIELLERTRSVLTRPWREANREIARLPGGGREFPTPRAATPFIACRIAVCRDNAVARRGLLQAALAIEEYRARHGAYPVSLEEASAEGLPIPADVYSGAALVYRAEGGRMDLRSVGRDLVERGAALDDIVWGHQAQERY